MDDGAPLNQAARRTLDLYREESLGVRLHTGVRWRTCPFSVVAAVIPPVGRILEIGCGHGLLAAYLALESCHREVWGTDVDGTKIRAAARAGHRAGANIRFLAVEPGELPQGPWDAIALVDVLYLMEPAGQEKLLLRAASLLAPGGALVVKEMDSRPAWKFTVMRLQEVAAVRLLRITAGATLTFVPPARAAEWLTRAGLVVDSRRIDGGYPHPHHLLVARRLPSS